MVNIVGQLKRELADAQRTYDTLLTHAQGRMSEANEELYRLKSTMEIELSGTRAKLTKSELKVASLETSLESRTKENAELMIICDELIQKIDSQAAAANGSLINSKTASILSSLNIPK